MTDFDVIVIGGGIIGCLIAREVIARGTDVSVALLDRDLVGSGASRRSAGLHFPRGASARVRDMTAASQDYYEQLRYDRPDLPIHSLEMSVLARETEGVDRYYLDRANATRIAGLPGDSVPVPPGMGVWNVDGGHYADVAALVVALTAELRQRVHIRESTAVTAVEPDRDEVVVRLGTGETLCAAIVVLAPGPWVHAPAWRAATAPLGVRVKLVAAMHIDQAPTASDRVIVFQDPDAFLLPMAHRGHWLFSFTSQQWDVEPDALTGGASAACLAEGRDVLAAVAPRLAGRATAGRVFCDAYSPNREPLIRALAPDRRVIFAGAANGSGYRLAPAIAAEAVDLLSIGPARRPLHVDHPIRSR
ncbi:MULTISPECIES: FAD-binding oxidoreductase [unclassified Nocardia]|uniref:NAD(P)/FAD-dependent oxidoreductase n=1 Tax=unclassified Nocardia TaxID=2637762 RepID=UPI001CE4A80A|nr:MULTISPECIES: FAD-dependent oxidoreductase [unclassified Nocardia]